MTTQTEAQRLAEKLKSYSLRSGYAWHCHKAADELLRLEAEVQALRGAVPAGWKMVPIKATEAMLQAGAFRLGPFSTWAEMLAAAPQPERHDELRCAVGNCTFNGGVATHTPGCPSAPQPAAQPTDMRTMELAESVGLIGPESRTHDLHGAIQRFHDLIAAEASIKAAQAFAQTLAQEPAGEPVGWINAQALEELRKPEMTWMPAWNRQNCTNPVAIYTRPAVPLSDEQIAEITVDFYGSAIHEDDYGFARAIEAAHKIGGAE